MNKRPQLICGLFRSEHNRKETEYSRDCGHHFRRPLERPITEHTPSSKNLHRLRREFRDSQLLPYNRTWSMGLWHQTGHRVIPPCDRHTARSPAASSTLT